jgi:hypothetical protein
MTRPPVKPFKLALLAAEPAEILRVFMQRHRAALDARGVEVAVIVLDENRSKSDSPLKHSYGVARRQARAAGCSTAMGVLKLLTYKAMSRLGGKSRADDALPALPADLKVVHVGTLNSDKSINAVVGSNADLVCLMGARILTQSTLQRMPVPAINIHTSDPRFMRGSPSVVWEVLAGESEITLTIHRVTGELDAGAILVQAQHPIAYCGGLGRTAARTITSALPRIADLFLKAIEGIRDQKLAGEPFAPGPLRVTPPLLQTLRAELLCRCRRFHSSRKLMDI